MQVDGLVSLTALLPGFPFPQLCCGFQEDPVLVCESSKLDGSILQSKGEESRS